MTPPNYGKIRQAKGTETNRNRVIKQLKSKTVECQVEVSGKWQRRPGTGQEVEEGSRKDKKWVESRSWAM